MVCNDGYAIIIATYSGTPTTILWEQSADGGQTWSAVPNTSNYSAFEYSIGGWSRANLQIGSTVGIDDYQFRVTLSNASGSTGPSGPAKLYNAQGPPNAPTFVSPVTDVCPGQSVSYTLNGGLKNDSIYWSFSNAVADNEQGINDTVVRVNFADASTGTLYAYASNGCGTSGQISLPVSIHPAQSTPAGTAGGGAVCNSFTVSPGPTPSSDESCNPITVITPSGTNPVTGNIQSCVTVDAAVQSYNGIAYVPRHYSLEPSTNASTSTATVTLYFTQADFDAYNTTRGTNPALPQNPTDAPASLTST